jgi:3-hydroxyacyl-CoA dehydrogenase
MADGVTLTRDDNIGIITLDNPPVNGLSFAVRRGLSDQVEAALSDDTIEAIVVTGAGKMFCGGADIRQFGQTPPADAANLPAVINRIENSSKPVVAAIHGVAAGGGLEVGLGCHYRLASTGTRLGLPEVTLGFVPGAGGTQRLPRLIGVQNALDVIVNGRLLPSERAQALGIVDEVVDGDLFTRAVTFARGLVGQPDAVRKVSEREEGLEDARSNPAIFSDFRKKMARRARGFDAPYACVECIEYAVTLPFEAGLAKEREIFSSLVTSDQAKAQRHVFFAEREVAKIPDVPKDTPSLAVETAAVIGSGTMGGGIAMNFANAGLPVTVFEVSQDALDKGMATIRKNYAATVSKGRLAQAEMDRRMSLISPTLSYDDLAQADLVVEAVFEEMDLKKRTLDATCKAATILATNTSTLDVNEIATATNRPEKVIGTHFFSPANVMRLMENVRGQATSAETIATIMKLSKQLGKVGVLVGVCDGFVGNRMLFAYRRQAEFLLEEGVLPQQLDKAIYDFGMPMGPFQMSDLAGLDISWRVRKSKAATRPAHLRYSPIADRICEMGRLGQKTGAGWYRYEDGSREPIPDPIIEQLIISVSEELGITRRPVSDDEIMPRCLYPLINEGAKILEEGLAQRSSDIDIIWIYGYGFPRYRGGPMFWADQVGPKKIYETMKRLHDEHGDWLKPSPLLGELARDNRSFKDL